MSLASRLIPRKDHTYQAQVGREIPLSFGANFNDDPICRLSLRKSHTLGHTDVQHPLPEADPASFDPYPEYDFAAGGSTMIRTSQAWGAGASGSHLQPSSSLSGTTATDEKNDDVNAVLRFLGYFVETLSESALEATRVRKVAVIFHCSDESILLREASQINSGILQGVMLKRQRVPKPENTQQWITAADLAIGGTVTIFGKHITLVDASNSTKDYMRRVLHMDVPEAPLPWPTELDTYNATVTRKLAVEPRRLLPTADYDHKRASEAMRGSGVISKHAPADVRTAQQFFRNRINEHLQFMAYWDDRERKSGDLRFAFIRYYLENDTIEIVEHREDNSGREGGAKLLCRQRVAHPSLPEPQMHNTQQNTYGLLLKENFISFDDLSVGAAIPIAGRVYHTYDADPFTRNWYIANRGIELAPRVDISDVVSRGTRPPPVHYPPPHNGWGTEEDSIRSCKGLLLKPPPIDVAKLAKENGKVMTFSATLHNPTQPEDVGREFVISFHRATDAVEITERQLRNSGIVGGKFLAKGRHLKTLSDGRRVPYTPDDFVLGNTVRIAGRDFLLTRLDERSRRMLSGEADPISEDRVKQLVVAFRELLNTKFFRAHEGYRALAPEGTLTAKELMAFFARSSGDITQEEADHLIHHLSGGKGAISYDDFIACMDPGNTSNLDAAANNVRAVKGVELIDASSPTGKEIHERLANVAVTAEETAALRRVQRLFAEKLVQRRGTLQETFRMLTGHALNARLSMDALRRALRDVLRIHMSPRDEELFMNSFFDTDSKRRNGIDFKDFHEFVENI